MKVFEFFKKMAIKNQRNECKRIAHMILNNIYLGDEKIQKHLENARDELYIAAILYQDWLDNLKNKNN